MMMKRRTLIGACVLPLAIGAGVTARRRSDSMIHRRIFLADLAALAARGMMNVRPCSKFNPSIRGNEAN